MTFYFLLPRCQCVEIRVLFLSRQGLSFHRCSVVLFSFLESFIDIDKVIQSHNREKTPY